MIGEPLAIHARCCIQTYQRVSTLPARAVLPNSNSAVERKLQADDVSLGAKRAPTLDCQCELHANIETNQLLLFCLFAAYEFVRKF